MNENLYTLICPNCGEIYKHVKRVRVCSVCGSVAVEPPLTDVECEKILEGDGEKVKAHPTGHSKVEDTSGRTPEDGGRTF